MAKTATIKVPADIEYTVIGNMFGLLIASGGLLAGVMVHEGSFDYWTADLVPLLLAVFMAFRLVGSFSTAMLASQSAPASRPHASRKTITPEAVAMGQLPRVPGFTTEQVLEEVAKRIENNKAKASK